MPPDHSCSRCRGSDPPQDCVVSESSPRCARCTRLGRSCDVKKFSGEELSRIQRARRLLDTQLLEATSVMSGLVAEAKSTASKLHDAAAKVERLERTRQFVVAKEHALVAQGMRELDTEDNLDPPVPDFNDFAWEGLLPEEPLSVFPSGNVEVPPHNGSGS